jgi:hypothetical protein
MEPMRGWCLMASRGSRKGGRQGRACEMIQQGSINQPRASGVRVGEVRGMGERVLLIARWEALRNDGECGVVWQCGR